jgi:3-deoxy-D-manno-octulosonate 8-phosphate phosphatase (KDO 8-P phosphatase)
MKKARKVKLLVLDVDGTLTDGKLYIDHKGNETKSFYAQDGAALKMLMNAGIKVALLSGRRSLSVEKRAQELGIDDLYQAVEEKFTVLGNLMKKYNVSLSEVSFVGDDITDLPLIRQVGYSFAPANARQIVKQFSHYVTESNGGEGAVAEACEKILRMEGLWDEYISKYL